MNSAGKEANSGSDNFWVGYRSERGVRAQGGVEQGNWLDTGYAVGTNGASSDYESYGQLWVTSP